MAQAEKGTPPSVVTSPPRDFGPNAPPDVYSSIPTSSSSIRSSRRLRQGKRRSSGCGRARSGAKARPGAPRAGISCGATSRTTAAALARRRRTRQRLPHAVEQQQRQHLRLPGPADFLRAPDRRVVRYEHDGSVTVIADKFKGKRLNSPNDVVPHPRRQHLVHRSALWRPALRGRARRGGRAEQPGGPAEPAARPAGRASASASASCRPAVYRVDPSGRLDLVVTEDQVPDPNGLCFSPDYKKLYVISTGKGPGDTGPGGKGDMHVFDVGPTTSSRTRSSSAISWSTA